VGSGVTVQGVYVPALLYGTAWKEDATTEATSTALQAGFRGVDTANQRKHYHEAAVGLALRTWFRSQVAQSHASSLEHLGVEYLDAYLLHGPEREVGLSPGDWEVWRAMEALHDAGTTDPRHMREDLACQDVRLAPDDVRRLQSLLGE